MRKDQVVCKKCNGEGAIHGATLQEISFTCPKCDGVGILDWIENIMGKPSKFEMINADPDDAVDLYYEGNKLYETTKTGIKVYTRNGNYIS